MTNVVAIEFCEEFFKSEKACYDWLNKGPYSELLRVVGFNLRRNTQSRLLTTEKKRAVFQWTMGMGSYSGLNIERPMSTVVVATAAGTKFTPTDLPHPLQKTIDRERKKVEAHRLRVAAQRKAREEAEALAPPKPPRKRKATSKTGTSRKKKTAAAYLAEINGDPYGVNVGTTEQEASLTTLANAAGLL